MILCSMLQDFEYEFEELKINIVKAAKNAPHMREFYPIRWLSFQRAIVEQVAEGKPHMTLDEVWLKCQSLTKLLYLDLRWINLHR